LTTSKEYVEVTAQHIAEHCTKVTTLSGTAQKMNSFALMSSNNNNNNNNNLFLIKRIPVNLDALYNLIVINVNSNKNYKNYSVRIQKRKNHQTSEEICLEPPLEDLQRW